MGITERGVVGLIVADADANRMMVMGPDGANAVATEASTDNTSAKDTAIFIFWHNDMVPRKNFLDRNAGWLH